MNNRLISLKRAFVKGLFTTSILFLVACSGSNDSKVEAPSITPGASDKQPNDGDSTPSTSGFGPENNFTISDNIFTLTVSELDDRVWTRLLTGSLKEVSDGLYLTVVATGNLVDGATARIFEQEQSGELVLGFTPANNLSAGVHTETIQINACVDVSCNTHYKGSPRSVDIIYSVVPNANPDTLCVREAGVLFSDCVDPDWLASAWVGYDDPASVNFVYFSGSEDYRVNWSTLDTAEQNYGPVLDIKFNKVNDEMKGSFRFKRAGEFGEDLTAYAGGTVEFDVRVLEKEAETSSLFVFFECFWPCGSTLEEVVVPELNTWTHVSINIDDHVANGLDLNRVNHSLIIGPAFDDFNSMHFQIDNVRWVPAAENETAAATASQ